MHHKYKHVSSPADENKFLEFRPDPTCGSTRPVDMSVFTNSFFWKLNVLPVRVISLARDAFVRIVALLPWCSSISLSGTGVHCDHTVHFSADLSLWLDTMDSAIFWGPWHQSMSTYSQPSFSSSTWKRGGGMDVQTRRSIKQRALNTNNDIIK